jgi:parallel beta-helix repeat protein
MSDDKGTSRGSERMKFISVITAVFMITGTMVLIIPVTMPTVAAWATPDSGGSFDFDDLVAISGGAVTGGYPNYQINENIIISPTDTLDLMPQWSNVLCAPGTALVVEGFLWGSHFSFHGTGIKGEWQGIINRFLGDIQISGVDIQDAVNGVNLDVGSGSIDLRHCVIDNCETGIRCSEGIAQVDYNTIYNCTTGIELLSITDSFSNNSIYNCILDGVYVENSFIQFFDNNEIYDNGRNGVWCNNNIIMTYTKNKIYGNKNDAFYLLDSSANLNSNMIFGWNATPGSGLSGGHAVHITGSAYRVLLQNNIIIGGSGDQNLGIGSPNGGDAIWVESFEGSAVGLPKLNIDNNTMIKGGNGGFNDNVSGTAGNGGAAIRVDAIPDLGDPTTNNEALRITNNTLIFGGRGGDNNAPTNGFAGDGGYGIWISDDDFNGTLEISENFISGGTGGTNNFDPAGSPGTGGDGVQADNMQMLQLLDCEIMAGPGGTDFVNGIPGSNGSYGVYVNNIVVSPTLDNLTVHGASTSGIHFESCDGVLTSSEIFDCGVDAVTSGISALWSSDPLIFDNYIHNCSNGIMVGMSSHPEIGGNTVENSPYYGIYAFSNSNPPIYDTDVDQSGEYGMILLGGYSNTVENCSISNSGIADWWVSGNSHPISLNTTSDKSVYIPDSTSNLTMNWFMHTQVVDQFFAPVAGANVWINDTFGGNSGSGVTDANGWLNWTVVTEFVENQTTRTYYTPHNATASSGALKGWANPNPFMDVSRDVTIIFGSPSYNFYLDQGWNLISIPLVQADESIDQVLSTIDGEWDFMRIYDPLSPEPWKSNCTYWPSALNGFDTIDHTQGVWVHVTSPSATLTVSGNIPVSTDIPLYVGWNLVGYPSFRPEQISVALAGTGYDRPVEGFDVTDPYHLKQLPDTYLMQPGEAYWIHVPADAIWTVTNIEVIQDPYSIYGIVNLYDGTAAGGYNPLPSSGGATVDVTWYDPWFGWRTLSTVTNPAGQYMVDIFNYTDGGVVYVNATFEAPYDNNGYNYTHIDVLGSPGGILQEVVCGVPHDIIITNPTQGQSVFMGMPVAIDIMIVDRDGMLAQGYYTHSEGPLDWSSSDPAWVKPAPVFFNGTASGTPGQHSTVTLFNNQGWQSIEVWEGVLGGNMYLTPWGGFYIDPMGTIPGWFKDSDIVNVMVIFI